MMLRKLPKQCYTQTPRQLQVDYTYTVTMNVCDDNVGCNEVKNVMCYTTIPTLFVYLFYDHIPTFFYIFSEMFFYYLYEVGMMALYCRGVGILGVGIMGRHHLYMVQHQVRNRSWCRKAPPPDKHVTSLVPVKGSLYHEPHTELSKPRPFIKTAPPNTSHHLQNHVPSRDQSTPCCS